MTVMQTPLGFLLDPVGPEEFWKENYGQRALHIPGNPAKFSRLFVWRALNEVLNSSPHPHPGLKMTLAGKQFVPHDPTALIRAVQDGATLILEDIDRYDLRLGDFLSRLTEEIQEDTRFNLYVSYPEHQGYKNHYDTHDFFILQITGFKEWHVFPSTISSPLFFQKTHRRTPPPETSRYLHCTLSPGDVLYVPKGHWHYAIARREPSVHLTLAVFTKTGISFAKWLADELTDYEFFRRSLPLQSDPRSGVVIEDLRRELMRVLEEPDLYDRFLQYRTATSRNRQPFQFPQHTAEELGKWDGTGRLTRRVQLSAIVAGRIPGKVGLVCAGRIIHFDQDLEPLLRCILTSPSVTKEDLVSAIPAMSWSQIQDSLQPLIREGFVAFES